jgi:hypothetical protein
MDYSKLNIDKMNMTCYGFCDKCNLVVAFPYDGPRPQGFINQTMGSIRRKFSEGFECQCAKPRVQGKKVTHKYGGPRVRSRDVQVSDNIQRAQQYAWVFPKPLTSGMDTPRNTPVPSQPVDDQLVAQISSLGNLLQQGILTRTQFDAAVNKLLGLSQKSEGEE